MNILTRKLILLIACVFLAAGTAGPTTAQDTSGKTDWQEQYAYTLGMQAYVFGFPYVYLPSIRWNWVTVPKAEGSITPYAPLNHFYNIRDLATAEYRDGGSPNNDTLYSIAWVDVTKEPLILSHPEMGDRYFTFEIASLDSDNFAYVGKRTTGGNAGSFAMVGPDWKGALPIGGIDHGHKGYGLGLMVEALTQGLGGFGRADQPKEWDASVLVLAFAPEAFGGREAFLRQTDWLKEACETSVIPPGKPKVRLPGQAALLRKAEAEKNGLALDVVQLDGLKKLAKRFSLVQPAAN